MSRSVMDAAALAVVIGWAAYRKAPPDHWAIVVISVVLLGIAAASFIKNRLAQNGIAQAIQVRESHSD